MFRLSHAQLAALNETAEARLKRRVVDDVCAELPDWDTERDALGTVVSQLFDAGFTTHALLHPATSGLIKVSMRDDPKAAEARALSDAILFEEDHEPQARLSFFLGQELGKPPEISRTDPRT